MSRGGSSKAGREALVAFWAPSWPLQGPTAMFPPNGRGNLWESDLVAGVAFRPRKCQPSSRQCEGGAGWIDSDIQVKDGTRVAYRLYLPANSKEYFCGGADEACILVYFHANAELCTDIEMEISLFFDAGFQAVLAPEFRGFAWSGGKPRLASLAPDAEAFLEAAPEILAAGGIQAKTLQLVVHGRSLGSTCAVHLASLGKSSVSALIMESGVVNLLELPMVQQVGRMMPELLQMLASAECPLTTLEELRRVSVPTLIIHGDNDEISPVEQAVAAHKACQSSVKKLVRYPAKHNDLRLVAQKEYFAELKAVCDAVKSGQPAFGPPADNDGGFLSTLSTALRCLPGVRRCLGPPEEEGGRAAGP